jgi:hypothetical protein
MDQRSTGTVLISLVVILCFALALGWATISMTRDSIAVTMESWTVRGDRVDVAFTVRSDSGQPLVCVIRAQDRTRADVGYATMTVPPGQVSARYSLGIIAPAFVTEILGCAAGEAPQVIGPQFPPGVVPPQQPWTD